MSRLRRRDHSFVLNVLLGVSTLGRKFLFVMPVLVERMREPREKR